MPGHNTINNSAILVVDDDEVLCKLLQESLTNNQYNVHVLDNGEAIEDVLEQMHINLVILDVMLPGKNGLHWLQLVNEKHPRLPVLILSAQDTAQDRIAGLQLGAKDYLTKTIRYH